MSEKESNNYDWFQFLTNNRPISKSHLANLRKQFEKYGNITEVSPITVNKFGFILDGQHRRIICEEMGYPIFYNEVEVEKEITPAMNTNAKPWDPVDYIKFFMAYKPEYEILNRFVTSNDISYSVASAILWPLRGRQSVRDLLVTGDIVVRDVLGEAQKRMDIISEIENIFGEALTERYVRCILKCLYMDNFDINRYLHKAKKVAGTKSSRLGDVRCTTALDALKDIEGIYNFHSEPKNTVLLFR